MQGVSILTPYLMPPAIAGWKTVNLGDGFILSAIQRLVGPIAEADTFSPRLEPAAADQAAMEQSRLVILGGANQLNDNYRIWPKLTAERLTRSSFRFVPFGVGIHGDPSVTVRMSDETRAILEIVHQRVEFSSWRCPMTIAYLNENLPHLKDRFLLTGCPVIFDRPLLHSARFHDSTRVVAVTATERGDFWEREVATLETVARNFPRARRILVVHQNFNAPSRFEALRHRFLKVDEAEEKPPVRLRRLARKLGYRVAFPESAQAAIDIYAKVDLHVGSRLHAHLRMLSQNKRSFVIPVDDRVRGMAQLFDFPICDPASLESNLSFDFETVRKAAQRVYPNMQRFVRSLA